MMSWDGWAVHVMGPGLRQLLQTRPEIRRDEGRMVAYGVIEGRYCSGDNIWPIGVWCGWSWWGVVVLGYKTRRRLGAIIEQLLSSPSTNNTYQQCLLSQPSCRFCLIIVKFLWTPVALSMPKGTPLLVVILASTPTSMRVLWHTWPTKRYIDVDEHWSFTDVW